jgi:hypothetical protein
VTNSICHGWTDTGSDVACDEIIFKSSCTNFEVE